MKILDDTPFSLDAPALMAHLRIEPGSDDARDFAELVALAERIGKPKAAYAIAFIDRREDDAVEMGGRRFTSRALARNLRGSERVFPFVATCGVEMDEAFAPGADFVKAFWWDWIKAQLLFAADRHLHDHVNRRHRLAKSATMRPGSGDATVWPIEQQAPLFALLGDVEAAIGVTLTDAFLMLPNKTASGILYPTEVTFQSCEVCHREGCPNRHAEFNAALWDEIHN